MPKAPTQSFNATFTIAVRCMGCGEDRKAEGTLVMRGEKTIVAKARKACRCGDKRLRVTWAFTA